MDSAWSELWGTLFHRGVVSGVSYASVPHLVDIAEARRGRDAAFDPLHLVACIELARLERRGPPLPPALEGPYLAALHRACALYAEAIRRSWPERYREILLECIATLNGPRP
jgi:hypothetical protein